MFAKTRLVAGCLIIVCLAGAVSACSGQESASRGIEQLVADLASDGASVRMGAVKELAKADPADARVTGALAKALGDADVDISIAAAEALGEIGPPAQAASPALFSAMDDQRRDEKGRPVWDAAATALGRLGPDSLPQLIERLAADEFHGYSSAAVAVHEIGSAAGPALPAVLKLLERPDAESRHAGCFALMGMKAAGADAVPRLQELLASDNFHTQYWACRALGQIGLPAARPALPKLLDLVANGGASVRRNAATAVGELGSEAGPEVVPVLEKALDDPLYAVRKDAAIALGKLGPLAEPAVPALKAALERPGFSARSAAAVALWRISRDAETAVEALLAEITGLDEPWEAAEGFEVLGAEAVAAVPRLIPLLEAKQVETRLYVIGALASIGPAAADALPALEERLEDPSLDVRATAAEALRIIRGAAPPAGGQDPGADR